MPSHYKVTMRNTPERKAKIKMAKERKQPTGAGPRRDKKIREAERTALGLNSRK
jgi:hypothetical protein